MEEAHINSNICAKRAKKPLKPSADEELLTAFNAPCPRHLRYERAAVPADIFPQRKDAGAANLDFVEESARALIMWLTNKFKSKVLIQDIMRSPTVTAYVFRLTPQAARRGDRLHTEDIEDVLALPAAVRTSLVGTQLTVEVPNAVRGIVRFGETVMNERFTKSTRSALIGIGADGAPVLCELDKLSSMRVGGQTGSGAREFVHSFISSAMLGSAPDEVRFILCDTRGTEFQQYEGAPHLLFDKILIDRGEVAAALYWAQKEMKRRFDMISKKRCITVAEYNSRIGDSDEKLPHIVLVISELADMMASKLYDGVSMSLTKLGQMGRAAGIHVIACTTRPSVSVMTGTVKAHLTHSAVFRVASEIDSRIMMNASGAEKLCCGGDMLYTSPDKPAALRVQAPFIDGSDINAVTRFARDRYESDGYDAALDDISEIAKRL